MLPGCHTGYQKDRTLRVFNIFGVAWIMEHSGTNRTRIFSIGSLNATSINATSQTNAPFVIEQ
jgi:hypothetical protein